MNHDSVIFLIRKNVFQAVFQLGSVLLPTSQRPIKYFACSYAIDDECTVQIKSILVKKIAYVLLISVKSQTADLQDPCKMESYMEESRDCKPGWQHDSSWAWSLEKLVPNLILQHVSHRTVIPQSYWPSTRDRFGPLRSGKDEVLSVKPGNSWKYKFIH